jgi:hypothetical protein
MQPRADLSPSLDFSTASFPQSKMPLVIPTPSAQIESSSLSVPRILRVLLCQVRFLPMVRLPARASTARPVPAHKWLRSSVRPLYWWRHSSCSLGFIICPSVCSGPCKYLCLVPRETQAYDIFSVCLVVYTLLAETPEDVIFYWK